MEDNPSQPPPAGSARGRHLDLLLGLLLLLFGTYLSVLYFGFHPVPTSDFCEFLKIGETLLSLQPPSSFKRAAVLCVLIVGLSRIVGGPNPELTARWLLNGNLCPGELLQASSLAASMCLLSILQQNR